MIKSIYFFFILLFVSLFFISCSDSASGTTGGEVETVETINDLNANHTCGQNMAGQRIFVNETSSDHICVSVAGAWAWFESVSTFGRMEDCDASTAAKSYYVEQDEVVYICDSQSWVETETSIPTSSSSTDLPEEVTSAELAGLTCNSSIATQSVFVSDQNKDFTCLIFTYAEQEFSSWYPSVSTYSRLDDCNATTLGQFYYVQADEAIFQCVNEEWTEIQTEIQQPASSTSNTSSSGTISSSGTSSSNISSSGTPPTSSSTATKVVTFQENILWIPEYGQRARTFFNTVDEYSFYDDNVVTNDSSGWWEKYTDAGDGGTSTAAGTFEPDYLSFNVTLNYGNFSKSYGTDYQGYSYSYNEPNPYPFGGFQFAIAPSDGGFADLNGWEGVCITYTSTDDFAFAVRSAYTDLGDGLHWEKGLTASATVKTVEVDFSLLTRSQYATTFVSRTNALSKATGFQFAFRNDEAQLECPSTYSTLACNSLGLSASNDIKLYKIGKAGSCTTTPNNQL